MMFNSFRQLHWTVFILAFANGVIMTGFMMLLPLLPAYALELGFGEYEIGLLVASFFIGRVMFQFPLGILSDHFGRRWIIWASLLLFTLSTTAYALSSSMLLMFLLRLAQGVAASGFLVGSQSYVNDLTPTRLRGLANGVMSSAINIGVIAGPILGGTLSQAFDLRTPFWVGGMLGLVSFLLTLTIPGQVAQSPTASWVAIIPHLSRFRRTIAAVWSVPSLSLSLVQFMQMTGMGIFLTAVPILTAEVLSWSANEIALALALNGATAALASPYLGRLSDRLGRISMICLGLLILSLEGLVIYLHPGTTLTMVALALGGLGAPAYFNAFYSLEGDITQPDERGAVTGFVGSFGEWGSIIGSSLLTPLVWKSIDVSAPMGVQALLLIITLAMVLIIRKPLQRQIG
ncbi:MAG: MFS transporter [Thermoleophilia bacterium]